MKSPMVNNLGLSKTAVSNLEHPQAVRGGYSDLQVLSSAAGYYIGTRYEEFNAEDERVWIEPGSRDSGYFVSENIAAEQLSELLSGGPVSLRETP